MWDARDKDPDAPRQKGETMVVSAAHLNEAYVVAFPLIFNLEQVQRYVDDGVGANPAAAFNTFSHARTLAGPADTFVSINNDTLYSMAQLDLSVGPVLLEVPDTAERYYVLQFVDAWTNNFAYVGRRATGTKAGRYLLVPPAWEGTAPDDVTAIHAPTRVFSIVGRWACAGESDLPAVHALQDATTLTPLDEAATPSGIPAIDAAVAPEIAFLEKARVWSQAFPPDEAEQAVLATFDALGITASGASPYAALDAEEVSALVEGLAESKRTLIAYLKSGDVPIVNGWQLTYHAFDYNIAHFEVGAQNTPEFVVADGPARYVLRAAAALGGLWGNHAYEAAYAAVYVDADNAQLVGEHTYTLTFNPTPPVGAFWSITMYSVPEFFLVENDIERYSIGSNTPGLHYDDDGSLTIVMGATAPTDPRHRANWLPAPAGEFRPLLRMYEPDRAVIDGRFELPAIQRIS